MSTLGSGPGLGRVSSVAETVNRELQVVCNTSPVSTHIRKVVSGFSASSRGRTRGPVNGRRRKSSSLQQISDVDIGAVSRRNGKAYIAPHAVSASWDAFQEGGDNGGSQSGEALAAAADAPACMFFGPLERATREQLEQFYSQARDAYYSGSPLVSDDIYDQVERRLRWFHSEVVKKYPRCSIRALYCYSDAEADPSQMAALSTMWSSFLAAGVALTATPLAFVAVMLGASGVERVENPVFSNQVLQLDGALAAGICFLLGVVLASSSARQLKRIMQGRVVALQGSCPHCGEEVYSFIPLEGGSRHRIKAECHVCEKPLVFHAFIEESPSNPKLSWAYGRIYVVKRATDLEPPMAVLE